MGLRFLEIAIALMLFLSFAGYVKGELQTSANLANATFAPKWNPNSTALNATSEMETVGASEGLFTIIGIVGMVVKIVTAFQAATIHLPQTIRDMGAPSGLADIISLGIWAIYGLGILELFLRWKLWD